MEKENECQTCGKIDCTVLHTCPLAEEIYDSKKLCNCCDICTKECANSI